MLEITLLFGQMRAYRFFLQLKYKEDGTFMHLADKFYSILFILRCERNVALGEKIVVFLQFEIQVGTIFIHTLRMIIFT